jgi:pimeloyl-ACP methyl ester carboxylesterase
MSKRGRWQRRLCVVLSAVICLAAGQGCLSFAHWLDVPPKEQVAQSETIPAPCRNHVHIFLIHGLDPLDFANLSGLTTYIQELGYTKTYYGQLYHLWEFKNTMRRIHKQEPQARFVLVGFSLGAIMARELANAVKADGIGIDLLLYVGGFTLANSPRTQPKNVARLVSILTEGCTWDARLDRADNLRYTDVWHFGTATHPHTRELLSRELAAAARRVPYVDQVPPLPPELEDEIPLPRKLTPEQARQSSAQLPKEWRFLNSRSAVGEPPPPPLAKSRKDPKDPQIPFAVVP